MQGQHRKKGTLGSRLKPKEPCRFTPLLADIQRELGESWTFYKECIDEVLSAAANQQDTTAWVEQMQQLVHGNSTVTFSHEGILFLLRDMGIQLPRQQSWSEGEKLEAPSTHNDNVTAPPIHSCTMVSQIPNRHIAPHASTPRLGQQPANLHGPRQGVLPFDFSTTTQPRLTLPKDLKAFHYPPEQIVMTEGYVHPPPNPLRKDSKNPNPIFFADPVFKEDVAGYFGYSVQGKASNGSGNTWQPRSRSIGFHTFMRQTLPYQPSDDDLIIWKKKSEGSEDHQAGNGEVKRVDWTVSDTWPPWNQRLDLDL
ncbi:hypothetical protein EJ07DRAFT_156988 [Lizonia empirigonia]|nr:hypothetical protein EJ07DRAFT_156988 [Lizonia empirigonia]